MTGLEQNLIKLGFVLRPLERGGSTSSHSEQSRETPQRR